jgi:hypothetical protein
VRPELLWRSDGETPSGPRLYWALAALAAVLLLGLVATLAGDSGSALRTRFRLLEVGASEGFCSSDFLSAAWAERAEQASPVCFCESSGDPHAVSANGLYYGLFQVDPAVHGLDPALLYDPLFNSAFAAALRGRDGWAPWPVCGPLAAGDAQPLP